ncbi:DNA-processing protein DprA [Curtobacterium aurantiacum]|uniref:DNA-processing protein DprA n=1 Tax=Curtobacterium aurantiacum TaxID=3236919 RepID=A0ABS5VIT7_9MICO|nr:DNA-processing protein DprA [Curtobacterium flaccumfaciens]MBT1545211.1 DNA-processing protein DprA [Curtobacterium flaccumfaciens pv. flaccumfaciens]MBT1587942.1 DNA-processing protein DprA [Curtobacterium flaccumfaciens pv. flaccumfaciens]
MTPAGTELLDTVARMLGRGGAAVDPVQAAARVAWSAIVEPGDSVAGELIAGLGPERALGAVLLAADDEFDALLGDCVEAEVPGAEDPAVLLGVLQAAVGRWRPRLASVQVGDVLAAAGAVGAGLLVPDSDGWPSAVDDLGPHAPVVLWTRSTGAHLGGGTPALGVVGSRANTVAGAEAAAEITSSAADAGCTIVSGGAYGIDAVAHRVAVAAGAPTVAVLAGGIDQLYPAGNAQLLHNVARQGALLAESAPGTRPTRWRFLGRNRLIAALADVTVVVEAGARSGALNTAHHAAQLGRPVFAVPGAFASAASVGCHRLIAQGRAQIVVHPGDPTAATRTAPEQGGGAVPDEPLLSGRQDPEVTRVLDALGRRALPEAEIARRAGMSPADVADALALAQLQGLVVSGGGGWGLA